MRRVVVLALVTACGFERHLGDSAQPGDDAAVVDAADIDVPIGTSVVAIDSYSNGQTQYTSAVTVPHTVGSAANRLLLVAISISFAGTRVTTVTYGLTPLTLVGVRDAADDDGRVEMWALVAPSSGTANVVVAVDDTLSSFVVGVGSFSNVNQATPLGAFASAIGTSGKPSITIAAQPTELVHDVVMWNGGDYSTLTVDTGQTAPWKVNSAKIVGGGSRKLGGGTLSWSVNGNYNDWWAVGAVAIKPL